jgi:hypothetical protein
MRWSIVLSLPLQLVFPGIEFQKPCSWYMQGQNGPKLENVMDKLKLTGLNLGQVFNYRCGYAST